MIYIIPSGTKQNNESYRSALDESNDTNDTAQLLIVIPGIRASVDVVA
jgi:hypothetical protein